MFKLDDNLLKELGLGSLPADEKNKMLAHIYETLEMRVGMKLAEQMTDQQLSEFESFIDANDEAGALKWLESNFPNYKQVVADELETLKAEIKQAAPHIVAASQEAQAQLQASAPYYPPAQPQQPMPGPQQPQYQAPPAGLQQYPQQSGHQQQYQQPPAQYPQYPQPPHDQS